MDEPVLKAKWKDLLLYRLGRRRAVAIEGDSMRPTLNNGDVVLVHDSNLYGIGDIVLAKHPYKASVRILKRLTAIDEDGALQLTGDNSGKSTDSRTFGAVSIESVLGKVVCRLK